jgi:fermentation-respiration switch protein FrsA (DUF1100 family)
VAVAALVLAAIAVARALCFDAPDEFLRQKGELVSADLEPVNRDSLYESYQVTLRSGAGYAVRGYLRVPVGEGRWPAIVVVGGVDTGRMAAELFTPDEPYVILGLDYPWQGPTHLSWLQFLVRVFAIRRAMLLTPSAIMLAVDYLERRPDVDIPRLVLAGASFGAQLVSVAGALDERASSVLIIYGGGDYAALLRANLKVKPMWLRSLLARAGAWLLAPVEPLNYVGRIAPRQTVLINGIDDDRIPHHSVQALYAAAGEPKRLIWLEEGHISSRDRDLLERVLQAASQAVSARETASRRSLRGGASEESGE